MRRSIAGLALLVLLAGASACSKADEPSAAQARAIDPATGEPVVNKADNDPAAAGDPNVIGDVTPAAPSQQSYRPATPKVDTNVVDLTTPSTDQPR